MVSSILPHASVELVAGSSHSCRTGMFLFSQQGCRWNGRFEMPRSQDGSGSSGRPGEPITQPGSGSTILGLLQANGARLPAWSWPEAASPGCQDELQLQYSQHTTCVETVKCSRKLLGSGYTIQLDFHPNPRYHLKNST